MAGITGLYHKDTDLLVADIYYTVSLALLHTILEMTTQFLVN